MKSLQSWTEQFVFGVLVGGLIVGLGFWFGANWLSPSFLSAKLHEWLGSVGTAGALFAISWGLVREGRWRRSDAQRAAWHAWAAISSDLNRLDVAVNRIQSYLKNALEDPNGLVAENLTHQVKAAQTAIAALKANPAKLVDLPVIVAQSLKVITSYPESWADSLERLIKIDPASIVWQPQLMLSVNSMTILEFWVKQCKSMEGLSDVGAF